MNNSVAEHELAPLHEPSLMVSDSQRRFNLVRDAARQCFAPRDFVEHMWVTEIVEAEWETQRLRRFKTLMVTANRLPALENLLKIILETATHADVRQLAERHFTNKSERRRVEKLLFNYGLSAASIDAEALRLSADDLVMVDQRLVELAVRRDKNVQLIEEHRAGLATPCAPHPAIDSRGN